MLRCILQAKMHRVILVVGLFGHESRFLFVQRIHEYLVVVGICTKWKKSLYSAELSTNLFVLKSGYESLGHALLRLV